MADFKLARETTDEVVKKKAIADVDAVAKVENDPVGKITEYCKSP